MSKLRIALVANNIHFRGGMERYCAELARYLCRDHEVHLFASEIDDVPFDKVTVHYVRTVKRPIITLFAQYFLRSSRAVRDAGVDFDIIHTIGGITARQNVVTTQYCQYAWGDVLKKEGGKIEGISAYHHFMWRLAGYFERKAVASPETRAVSAVSERVKQDLIRFYGCPKEKIDVIYNAVDPDRFHPDNRRFRAEIRTRYAVPGDRIVALFVGEYRRKGLGTVIEALGKVDNPDVHLLAVGRGNLAHYQALAEKSGIADRMTLAEPARDIERVFGAADLFVFPTYYEPFGMVITEAMASGVPVITTRRSGAAEMIVDGVSGLLVESPSDTDELAGRISQAVNDPFLLQRLADNSRDAVSHHTWETVGRKTVDIYHRVAAKAPQMAK
ncbi:MAG: glycosyltransferase family 4 protein [Capsulimonadaceae bacterium]